MTFFMETKRPIDPGRRLIALAAIASLALVNYSAAQTISPEKPATARPKPALAGAASSPAPVDSSVKRTGGHHESVASPQVPVEQAPQAPMKPQPAPPAPVAPVAPVQPTYVPQYQPTYPAYAPVAPTAPVTGYYYVQQPVAPAPMAPMAPVAPTAPTNFFLPTSPPPMAPAAPQPVAPMAFAPAPQPMAFAPMAFAPAPQPVAFAPVSAQPIAPVSGAANLTNQTVSVPTSRSSTRVRVRGPGMINAGLARFGERLVQLGRTQDPDRPGDRTGVSAGPAVGGSGDDLDHRGHAHCSGGPRRAQIPPQAPQVPVVPEGPTASPQGVHQKHSLIHHLMGHDD